MTDAALQRTVALAIEGVGSDAGESRGLGIFYGRTPTGFDAETNNREWVRALVPNIATSELLARPFIGAQTLPSYSFRIRWTEALAKALLYSQFRAPHVLTASMSSTGTTMAVSDSANVNIGEVVWIDSEAILVVSSAGGGAFNVTRGYYDTVSEIHATGKYVFTKQPYVRFRSLTLKTIDEDDNVTDRWEGYINGASTTDDHRYIILDCRSVGVAIDKVESNVGVSNHANGDQVVAYNYLSDGNFGLTDQLTIHGDYPPVDPDNPSSVFKATAMTNELGSGYGVGIAVIVDGGLTAARYREDANGNRFSLSQCTAQLGSRFGGANDKTDPVEVNNAWKIGFGFPTEIYEVFAVSQVLDDWTTNGTLFFGRGPVSATRDLPYPYHPLSIVAAMYFSDNSSVINTAKYNVLNSDYWGNNLEYHAQDDVFTVIDELIAETSYLKVDQLILGELGSPVNIWEEGQRILRNWGFYTWYDTSGRFSFARVKLIDIEEYNSALGNVIHLRKDPDTPPLLKWEAAYEETFDSINLRVGELPWQKPVNLPVNVNGISSRSRARASSAVTNFELREVSIGRIDDYVDLVARTSILMSSHIPRFSILAEDLDADNVDLGNAVVIDDLPIYSGGERAGLLVGSDGELATDLTTIGFSGRVIGHQWDPLTFRYRLRLWLTNHGVGQVVRWRAPSLYVTGFTAGGTHAGGSEFGAGDFDSVAFYSGDEIQVWEPDMSLSSSTVHTVVSVNSTSLFIPTLASSIGKIIRLAPFDPTSGTGYSNTTIFANIDRVWAGMADSSADFGASLVDADIYG